MRDPGRLKKSEMLEVRLPHATKQAFMARCQANGRSASEAVRDFIQGYVEDRGAPPVEAAAPGGRHSLRWIAGAAAALAFGAAAAPSLALPTLPTEFAHLDADHDGGISPEEFAARATLKVAVSLGAASPVERLSAVFAPGGPARKAERAGGLLDAELQRQIVREEFDRIDADHDSRLSYAEFRRYYGR